MMSGKERRQWKSVNSLWTVSMEIIHILLKQVSEQPATPPLPHLLFTTSFCPLSSHVLHIVLRPS